MRSLFLTILFLLGLGLVQIYSSSFIFAIESFDDGLFFVKKQALFVCVAIVLLVATTYIPWKWLEKIGVTLWGIALLGVALTLVPGIGVKVGGASRWLSIGAGLRFEPSELLKYTYPFFLSLLLTNKKYYSFALNLNENREFAYKEISFNTFFSAPFKNIFFLVLPFLPIGLLLVQPDFGSTVIITCLIFAIFFSQGLKWSYVFTAASLFSTAFYFLVVRVDYRMARLSAFLDPWADPAQKGFQVIQSMLGFYSGGLTGVGLGQGQGKLFFLPEAHTDFTLSVLGEELGFVGLVFVLLIFGYVVLRGLQISAKTKNENAKVIALGVTIMFAMTTFINVGVATGLLPTKGLGMPFLSYGGSSLLATCFGLGLLLNLERSRESKARALKS